MIAHLVRASARHRGATVAIWLGVIVACVVIAQDLKLDALPDVTSNQVQILTRAPGFSPEEVELLITRPVETALGGLPGLESHRSVSRESISAVTAVFRDGVDPFFARQLVNERLGAIRLPGGIEPPELGPPTGGLGEIYHFALSAPTRSGAELLELTQLRVVPLLRNVANVVEVNTWGGERRTLDVHAHPERLALYGLSLDDLGARIGAQIGITPGGALEAGGRQTLLRGRYRPTTAAELAVTPIPGAQPGDPSIPLSAVADVRDGALRRLGAATANGRGEVVYVMVQMLSHANARETVRGIRAVMPMVAEVLPDDVHLQLIYDRAELVDHTLATITRNMVSGGLLVIVLLLLLLGSLRAGLLVALVVPLSVLGGAALMTVFGIPGNLMSLGAVDFGLLVDGGVVMVEHVFVMAAARRGRAAFTPRDVEEAVGTVARPVFYAVVVIMLVYVPILSLQGVDGKMFEPMAMTVILALAVALLVSVSLVPALAHRALPKDLSTIKDTWIIAQWGRLHRAVLSRLIRAPRTVLAVLILSLAVAGWRFNELGVEFVPQLDEGDLVLQTTRHPDIHLAQAVADNLDLEKALLTIPEVDRVVSRIGSPAVATDLMGYDQADVFIGLAPREAWREGLTREALIASMEELLEDLAPGVELAFTQPIQMRFNELVGGSPTDILISVVGEDLLALERVGRALVRAIEGVPGVEDLRVMAPPAVELIDITPRPMDCARHGLTAGEVTSAVRAMQLGHPVATTWRGPLEVPVLLKVHHTESIVAPETLLLPTATGLLVPLTEVADVRTRPTAAEISHDGGLRRLKVGFNVRGARLGDAVAGARAAVAAEISLPEGVRLEWGGQVATLDAATERLQLVIPIVLLLVIVSLYLALRQIRPVLIVLTHIPFAWVGGVLALDLAGLPLSMSAAIGFIALSGIAVMNGVVLVGEIVRLERDGASRREASLRGAYVRARPVLMTALSDGVGFLPMVLSTGIGAEVQRPLATVVVGGLLTSMSLTLFILPVLYPFLGRRDALTGPRPASPQDAQPPAH